MKDLVDCLDHWVPLQPEKTLFSFLDGRGQCREHYTYEQFYLRTLGLAQHLDQLAGFENGDRVLLVYPPGLEMIVAFFASLNLGLIPVPVCAPVSMASGAGAARIEHIARDCEARAALTTASYLRGFINTSARRERSADNGHLLESLPWFATDAVTEQTDRIKHRRANPVSFLQYTSGSTGDPKGVMVTHRNVMHNALVSQLHCPVGASWLPQYHDMGLIGNYLYVMVLGGTNYGFSPFDFLRRPALWLQTISNVRATFTGAPNFAFGYCLRDGKVSDAELCDVDLSSLEMMLNASEPVHPQTYKRFFERFEPYGLRRESYEVGYGLAENTLGVSRRGRHTLIVQKQRMQERQLCIQKSIARNNNQLSLVSCGAPLAGVDVRVVDPQSRLALGENAVGEIWIDGESKCGGYWKRSELTQAIFHARVENEPDNLRDYLRTGDLGFFHEGELFVCGRLKDMIIIRGTNYYPQDIEAIVEAEFPSIAPGGPATIAAFAIDQEGEERLVVVIEVRPRQDGVDPAAVAQAIRSRYFIDPHQILFVPPRTISKTTSGKVIRGKTRDRWLRGDLPVLASYVQANSSPDHAPGLTGLVRRIRQLYRLRGDEAQTLADIGLDSLTLVELTLAIQRHFDRRGLGHLVADLDARFLQRLTVAELSHLLDTYEARKKTPAAAMRTWFGARQRADDARERQQMKADTQWYPPSESPNEAKDTPESILVTGASGFFGPFLLSSLLQQTACRLEVLVRAADPGHGRARLIDGLRRTGLWTAELQEEFRTRVSVVCGDLGLERLGLNDDQWSRLAQDVDAVVHSGAQVNYVLSYDALRPYNVGGTHELMRLAATARKKPFHLVSSTFIHGWSTQPIASELDHNEDMRHLDFGYAQSKWVAEHLVRNAERHGQPIRIYRPAFISASSRGVGGKDDIVVRLLAFMIKHGLGVEAFNQVSLLPADLVADHIARLFQIEDTGATTFHLTTGEYYNMMDVTRSIGDQFGYTFTYYELPRFIEEINRLCTPDDPLYPLLVFINRSYQKLDPMKHKRYDNRHYRTALNASDAPYLEPKLSDTVAYIVKHMQRQGLIPARGDFLPSAEPGTLPCAVGTG